MCQCGWISTISHFLFSYHIIYRTTRILWTILGQTLYSFTYSLTRLLVVAFFPFTLLTNHTWFIHFVLLLLLFICWYYICVSCLGVVSTVMFQQRRVWAWATQLSSSWQVCLIICSNMVHIVFTTIHGIPPPPSLD